MSLRSRLLRVVREVVNRAAPEALENPDALAQAQPLPLTNQPGDCQANANTIEAVEEIIPLTNKEGHVQAGLLSYGIEESRQIIDSLREEELYGTGTVDAGTLSPQIGDAVSGLTPTIMTGLNVGRVYQVIGPASVVEGIAQGTMQMVQANSGGLLGAVTQQGASQIAGQARFAQMSATSVVAPLMVYQAVHMIVGTQQINQINRRLAGIERTLERIVQRLNAKDLGEVIAAASTLRDILQEHQHSGRFNGQMRDRLSHCERDLRAHLERLKLLKSQFHSKLQAAQSKANSRDRAVQLATLIKEEGEQFGQDTRLLVALCGAVLQLEQGLMAIALEHHPESLPYRQKQMQLHINACQETLQDMANLSEVQNQIRICLDVMSWWQKNLFDRGGASSLQEASNLQLGDAVRPKEALSADGSGSMLVWMDPEKGVQVRAIAGQSAADEEAETTNNDLIQKPQTTQEEPVPEAQHLAFAPSTSLHVGEIYRLPITDLDRDVPIRILKKTGHGEWLGMRTDVPDVEYVEVMVDLGDD